VAQKGNSNTIQLPLRKIHFFIDNKTSSIAQGKRGLDENIQPGHLKNFEKSNRDDMLSRFPDCGKKGPLADFAAVSVDELYTV